MAMFTHVAVGTNDLAKARAFYDAVLAPLGYKRLKDLGDRGSCWGQSVEEFIVLTPADGKPASPANGGTVSFARRAAPRSRRFTKPLLRRAPRMKGPSGRAGSGPTPMPAMSAISTATSSRPTA